MTKGGGRLPPGWLVILSAHAKDLSCVRVASSVGRCFAEAQHDKGRGRQPPGWFVILRPQPKDLSCVRVASSMGGDASLRLGMTIPEDRSGRPSRWRRSRAGCRGCRPSTDRPSPAGPSLTGATCAPEHPRKRRPCQCSTRQRPQDDSQIPKFLTPKGLGIGNRGTSVPSTITDNDREGGEA